MKLKRIFVMSLVIAIVSAIAVSSAFAAENISLNDYIGQITEHSPGLKGATLAAKGYSGMSEGAKVLTFPHLFGNYSSFNDRQEMPNPAFQGDRTKGDRYSVGLSASTPIGLNARYSFNVANTQIMNATQIPIPNYYSAFNQLELTQSLVRNGFGSETRAHADFMRSSNLAQSFGNQYSALMQLVQAENTYWRLAFARRSIQVNKEVLARAKKVLQWAKRRVGLQLGDRADLLQAQASYDLRRIELMNAEEEERNASRAFNLLRNREGAKVAEQLTVPTLEATIALVPAPKTGTRFDVKAAEQEKEATTASVQLEKERLKPTLDLFANVALTGRDPAGSEAIGESFGSNRSNMALGINFNVPLQVPAVRSGIEGADTTQEAAIYKLEQRRIEEARDWEELQSRLADSRSRLALLKSVEGIQREKYENEQGRLLKGRTTTYQAISFEQDYAATQLLTLRTQNEVLQLLAQLKLFQGN